MVEIVCPPLKHTQWPAEAAAIALIKAAQFRPTAILLNDQQVADLGGDLDALIAQGRAHIIDMGE